MTDGRVVLVFLALVGVASCRAGEQPQRAPAVEAAKQQRANMPAEYTAQLDSGNDAYSAKDLEAASRHYRAATRIDDGIAAAWFGVYMVEQAMGHADSAQAAYRRAQAAAPGTPMIHPGGGDTLPGDTLP